MGRQARAASLKSRDMKALRWLVLPLVLGAALQSSARAQDDPHAACAAPPSYVPGELLERPVSLRTGIGNSHEAVTTSSAKARRVERSQYA